MNNWKTPNMFGAYNDLIPNSWTNKSTRDYWRKENMTYILGARCSDGVVLVSDTKVIKFDTFLPDYEKKIDIPFARFGAPFNRIIMCSSGISGLYENFKDKVSTKIKTLKSQKGLNSGSYVDDLFNITEEDFKAIVQEVIFDMRKNIDPIYKNLMEGLQLVCACRINGAETKLFTFDPFGLPKTINESVILGHSELYAYILLKAMRNYQWTMEQAAKFGIFSIKLIRDIQVDFTVGFTDESLPQVFYFKNVETDPIKELSQKEVQDLIDEADSIKSEFQDFMCKKFKCDNCATRI